MSDSYFGKKKIPNNQYIHKLINESLSSKVNFLVLMVPDKKEDKRKESGEVRWVGFQNIC